MPSLVFVNAGIGVISHQLQTITKVGAILEPVVMVALVHVISCTTMTGVFGHCGVTGRTFVGVDLQVERVEDHDGESVHFVGCVRFEHHRVLCVGDVLGHVACRVQKHNVAGDIALAFALVVGIIIVALVARVLAAAVTVVVTKVAVAAAVACISAAAIVNAAAVALVGAAAAALAMPVAVVAVTVVVATRGVAAVVACAVAFVTFALVTGVAATLALAVVGAFGIGLVPRIFIATRAIVQLLHLKRLEGFLLAPAVHLLVSGVCATETS
jgi:hypothetical protein